LTVVEPYGGISEPVPIRHPTSAIHLWLPDG
jgi:hypothetical protein